MEFIGVILIFMWVNILESTFLKFEWNVDNWIKIDDLSNSLIWYEKFIKSSFKSFDINIENIELKIYDIRKWSIIVDIFFQYELLELFLTTNTFLDILKIVDINIFNHVQENIINVFWVNSEVSVKSIWESIEAYWRQNPVRSRIWVTFWTHYSLKILDKLLEKIYYFIVDKKLKNSIAVDNYNDEQEIDLDWVKVKWKYLKKLKNTVINKWRAKELLEPIINDDIEVIKIWNELNIINTNNINLFLWEWNEILPFLINWQQYEFIGSFTAMQSNKWETMKFKSQLVKIKWRMEKTENRHWEDFLFVVNLPYWETTESYISYYWESKILNLKAEILRENEYKKPKLRLISVDLINKPLFESEEYN